jgi:hypothetical protein
VLALKLYRLFTKNLYPGVIAEFERQKFFSCLVKNEEHARVACRDRQAFMKLGA